MAQRSLPRYASLAMIALGVITFLVLSPLMGIILAALGLVMYLVHRHVMASVQRSLDKQSTDEGP